MEEAAAVVSNRHADIDFFIYATVGPLCFIVVLGFLLVTLYKYVRKHPIQWPWKRKFRQPSFWPGGGDHQQRHRRMTDECGSSGDCGTSLSAADEIGGGGGLINVIYSGEFEQSQQQQLSGSWLDDASFVPDDSLDRIRTPTLLRTTAVPSPAAAAAVAAAATAVAKNKTTAFTDMLQQCGGGGGDSDHLYRSSRAGGQCGAAATVAGAVAAVTAVHAQSPRLSRDNKLRILGCKQSCLLLPAVQPAAAVAADLHGQTTTAAPLPSSQPLSTGTVLVCEDDAGQP